MAPRASETDALGAYDAIFVGDVEPAVMASEVWARLESFVARRGGTLVLCAGPRAWPAAILGVDAVRRLLPVLDPRPVSFDPASVDQTHPGLAAGRRHQARRGGRVVADAPARCHSRVEPGRLGGPSALPWALAGRAKPGATTLAAIEGAESGGTSAVIAAQPYGLGKVLWVGTDATWRWRFRVGDTYHHRFWGQVVRWAAAGKLAVGDEWVRFGPDRSKVPEGESPRLTARFADDVAGAVPTFL